MGTGAISELELRRSQNESSQPLRGHHLTVDSARDTQTGLNSNAHTQAAAQRSKFTS